MILNQSSKSCMRSAPISGRLGALWLALLACSVLPCGSARADTITQADADRIAEAIVTALWNSSSAPAPVVAIDYDFVALGDLLRGVSFEGNDMTVGQASAASASWLHHLAKAFIGENYNGGWVQEWETASDDVRDKLIDLRTLLTTIEANTDGVADIDLDEIERALVTIRAAVSGGFSDENGQLVPHGIQSMLEDEAAYHAGYRTATSSGSWALSVRDDDAIAAIQSMDNSLSGLPGEVGDAVGDAFSEFVQDGTMRIYVEGMSSSVASSWLATWNSDEQQQLENLRPGNSPPDTSADMSSAEYAGQSAADEAEAELQDYTGDEYPLEEYTPDTSGLQLDAGNIPTLSVPSIDPQRRNVRVFEGLYSEAWGRPGWTSLAEPIDWTPWGDSESDRAGQLLKKAGRVMSGFWELAFGVWLFLLVRREVVYYVTLGQMDEKSRTAATSGEWSTFDD